MIKIVTTEEVTLTQVQNTNFYDIIETVLPIGSEVTLWLKAPVDVGDGLDLKWKIQLNMWAGNYTEKHTNPNIQLKEIKSVLNVNIFNPDGSDKYPFLKSAKGYVYGMIEDQNRFLIQYFYDEGIFPVGSLEVVGIPNN
jgi:hypothetical protein